MPEFNDLLIRYMGRAGATIPATAVAAGVHYQTINNWRMGTQPRIDGRIGTKPDKNQRPKVLALANFLELSEEETNEFLIAAGFKPEPIPEDLSLARALFRDYFQKFFDDLSRSNSPVKLLITQTLWYELPFFHKILLEQAKQRYLPNNVLHIHPPPGPTKNIELWFSLLGEQCGFNDVTDGLTFELGLKKQLLNRDQTLLLLVTRLDRGPQSLRGELGRIIRTVQEETGSSRLHIVLWGGEQLAELKYRLPANEPPHSLLNIARLEENIPELGSADVRALCQYRFPELQLSDDDVKEILTISGGHPQLLTDCLRLKQNEPDLRWEDYFTRFNDQCDYIWSLFLPFSHDDKTKTKVHQWLQQDNLGRFTPFIQNNLLRQLYWTNLLTVRKIEGKKCLFWRCELLRRVGKEILGNGNEPLTGEEDETGKH